MDIIVPVPAITDYKKQCTLSFYKTPGTRGGVLFSTGGKPKCRLKTLIVLIGLSLWVIARERLRYLLHVKLLPY